MCIKTILIKTKICIFRWITPGINGSSPETLPPRSLTRKIFSPTTKPLPTKISVSSARWGHQKARTWTSGETGKYTCSSVWLFYLSWSATFPCASASVSIPSCTIWDCVSWGKEISETTKKRIKFIFCGSYIYRFLANSSFNNE